QREEPAVLLAGGDDLAGDLAAIEGVAALGGNLFVARCEERIAEEFSFAGRCAVRKIRPGGVLPSGERWFGAFPVSGDHSGDGEAVVGVVDRRGQKFAERLRSKLDPELIPTVDAAGDRPTQRSADGDLGQFALLEFGASESVGTASAGVESVQGSRFGVPIDE